MPPTAFADEWLVKALVSRGELSRDEASSLSPGSGALAAEQLLKRGLVSRDRLAGVLKDQYGLAFRAVDAKQLDKMALSLVPERLCRRYSMVPTKVDGEVLEVLMANPLDAEAVDAACAASGRRIVPLFGLRDNIADLLAAGYGSDAAILDILESFADETPVESLACEPEGGSQVDRSIGAPIIRLANLIVAQAVRLGASDIHIEHDAALTMVRYRLDGDLRNMMKLPRNVGEGPLVSRVKIMANMDVADRRRPQDGRAKLVVGGQDIGLRVSTIPTSFGEKAVIRILDKRQAEVPLERLGYRPKMLERIMALSQSNQGLLLLTGPTGSGKTTTLYSILHRMKSEAVNTVTVEDPIEYRLQGVNQVQVNEKAGMTFASVLRSVLRQDPDIVLVGEIRDRETADVALQAALTGHMVFSTLHTNDSLATISRLLDMGVEGYKMSPALVGVVSQRLVRRVCEACRTEAPVDGAVAALLRQAGLPERRFQGKGCEACSFTGLSGRISVAELLDLSDPAARQMLGGGDTAALNAQAVKRGWLSPLSADVLWHLSEGYIPVEEAAAYLDLKGEPVHSARPADQTAGPRVLIVDDNADNRAVACATLRGDGYALAEADGGESALRQIAAQAPDLLVLDLMMPGVDGFAVVRQLRERLGLAGLPILVLTAVSEAESQAVALELGVDDYLTKPFDPRVLRARVKALFRRRFKENLSGS